jgi:hypothetical protein
MRLTNQKEIDRLRKFNDRKNKAKHGINCHTVFQHLAFCVESDDTKCKCLKGITEYELIDLTQKFYRFKRILRNRRQEFLACEYQLNQKTKFGIKHRRLDFLIWCPQTKKKFIIELKSGSKYLNKNYKLNKIYKSHEMQLKRYIRLWNQEHEDKIESGFLYYPENDLLKNDFVFIEPKKRKQITK